MQKLLTAISVLFLITACAGPNPNPGERTTDMSWLSGNHQKAISIAKPLAESGQPWAQLRMGILFENGWGVEQNTKEAERWYLKAAAHKADDAWSKGQIAGASGKAGYFNQNSDALIAEYNLASLYLRGDGIEKDIPKAYALINNVLRESNGESLFFCCEFDGGRYFTQKSFEELKNKIETEMNTTK